MINVDAILNIPFVRVTDKEKLTPSEKKLILNSYYEATGIRKQEGCGDCYIEAYIYFKKNHMQIIEKNMNGTKFRIKEGSRLTNHKLDIVVTNANLTDELAISILKIDKSFIKVFTAYPENWKDLLTGKKVKEVEVVNDEVISDIAEETKQIIEGSKKLRKPKE